MALKSHVKSLDEVDEKYRDLYVKNDDGTFRLDADGIEDVTGLKTALEKERGRVKELINKSDNGGLTQAEKEELAKYRKEAETAEQERLKKENDWKGLEQRLHDDYMKKLKAKEEEASNATTRLHKTLIENEATKAISKFKGKINPLIPHVTGRLKVIDENGNLKIVVADVDGQPKYSSKDPKSFMSVEELVETDFFNNEDFMGVFEGKGASGGGTPPGVGRGQGGRPTITKTAASDPHQYRQAQELAVKAGFAAPQVVEG